MSAATDLAAAPSGGATNYASLFSRFLQERPDKTRAFSLGVWLASLSDDQLEDFSNLACAMMAGAIPENWADVLKVVAEAYRAETKKSIKIEDPKMEGLLATMAKAASLEQFKRSGWVELDSQLSIKPHKKVAMRFTDLGKMHGAHLAGAAH